MNIGESKGMGLKTAAICLGMLFALASHVTMKLQEIV